MVASGMLQREIEENGDAGRHRSHGHQPEDPAPCGPFDYGTADKGATAVCQGNYSTDDSYFGDYTRLSSYPGATVSWKSCLLTLEFPPILQRGYVADDDHSHAVHTTTANTCDGTEREELLLCLCEAAY